MSEPGYWMYETSGVLRPAVEAYFSDRDMTPEEIAVMRAYLRQWVMASVWDMAPDGGAGIAKLRSSIETLTSKRAIRIWLEIAQEQGIDPL